jgi:hypothetical protein
MFVAQYFLQKITRRFLPVVNILLILFVIVVVVVDVVVVVVVVVSLSSSTFFYDEEMTTTTYVNALVFLSPDDDIEMKSVENANIKRSNI